MSPQVMRVLLASMLVGCGAAPLVDAGLLDGGAPDAGASALVDAGVLDGGVVDGGAGCPTGALWCDDFEAATLGSRWAVKAPNCSGTGRVRLEAGAVRVEGGTGYCDHVFLTTEGALPEVAWVRARVRFAEVLGAGHVTFFASADEGDQGKALRMGGQAGIFMWNRESDDATLPALSPQGIALSTAPTAAARHCLEFELRREGALTTFVDGVAVQALRVDGAPTAEVDQQWLARGPWQPRLTGLAFGWESYSGQAMTLWFDDLALATRRVGCP